VGEDVITLVLPRERDFHPVAHLVLGGLAARLDLTLESLDDLQLAVSGLLERDESEMDVTVRISVGGDAIEAVIGPFEGDDLRHELESDDDEVGIGLRRLLETVVDRVELEDQATGLVVRLVKQVDVASSQR
jgi:anti-sigma regulatory factor (Ser/Thr protein kinase)